MPKFMEWLTGGKDKIKKSPAGTPQQQQFHGDIMSQLQQMLQPGGNYNLAQQYNQNLLSNGPEAFQQFSQPYLQQFQEQLLPQIAERFAGAGALSSSGFGQALGGAASGLQSQLAQLFSSMQQQAAQGEYGQFNNLSQQGLNYQPYNYTQQKGSQGMLGPLATSFASAFGGPLAGMAANGIQSLFKQG